jgi:CheY-like chemotaxis protein
VERWVSLLWKGGSVSCGTVGQFDVEYARDFESLSCKVIPVFSGQSAWQALEIGPLPDVVIVDFVLTDEDGPEILVV